MSLVLLLLEAISPENHGFTLYPLVRVEQKNAFRVLDHLYTLPRSGKQKCLMYSEPDKRIWQAQLTVLKIMVRKYFGRWDYYL